LQRRRSDGCVDALAHVPADLKARTDVEGEASRSGATISIRLQTVGVSIDLRNLNWISESITPSPRRYNPVLAHSEMPTAIQRRQRK
jgi:hypothetical protein